MTTCSFRRSVRGVWSQDSGETDNGKIIQATWKSKIFLPVPDWNCQFRSIALRTNRTYGEIEIGWSIDHGRVSGMFTWDRAGLRIPVGFTHLGC